MVLMSNFVRGAVRMVRAASSGDGLDLSAKLAGIDNLLLLLAAWWRIKLIAGCGIVVMSCTVF